MQRLNQELQQITDQRIRDFAEFVLSRAPEYFWTAPSSSTGKYHPPQANGEGGLVRHTRAVVYLAGKLCEVYDVTGPEKDCVLAACLLHDIRKYGEVKQQYTTKNHDHDGGWFVLHLGVEFGLDEGQLLTICRCIAWHMGRWTEMSGRQETKIFPEQYTAPELIVHLADVISAQKCVSLTHIV